MTSKERTRRRAHGVTTRSVWLTLAAGIVFLPLVATTVARASNYSVIHTFGLGKDGARPHAGLIADAAGNFYGTTEDGGAYGFGAVFAVKANGQETVLYSFTGGSDGANPNGALVRDAAGDLYGTASGGGNLDGVCAPSGCGVVFKLQPGRETVLYTFSGGTDGGGPWSGLIRDASGNLYGTATYGGASGACLGGCGAVFKVDASGNETVLHNFSGAPDGETPYAGLVMDSAGNLYGITYVGGVSGGCGGYGCGIVFELDSLGNESILYTFTGGADGGNPLYGALVLDASGDVYGTATHGGATAGACVGFGCGVVFKVDPSGNETVLYTFTGGSDGAHPAGGVIWGGSSNLYGLAGAGGDLNGCGSLGCGVAFRLSLAGKEKVLYSFTDSSDGGQPGGGLFPYKGYLYGTTPGGGMYLSGVAFKLLP
ncbi:MAG TPA: choice-of-anchor tandem repeat GloVer-containing protein [Terriglobia bacterium]|nr:choice-of-anchor tandem repeat GloVer-containing protein [Terriglobia bacterium]